MTDIAVCTFTVMQTHVPYGITVLPANPAKETFPHLTSQLKLVLDLATPERCRVDLIGLFTYQTGIPAQRWSHNHTSQR